MNVIQSICILRLSAIGDVCHAVAVVQAIRAHFPTIEITWVIGRVEAELLRGLPGVRFVVFDKREGVSAYWKLRRELPDTFDVLLHMQVALRANLAALCIRARRKLGFPAHLAKEGHGLVVNERVEVDHEPHVLEGFAAFARAIGVQPFPLIWNLPVGGDDRAWLKNFLRKHDLQSHDRLVVISPSASKPERNWLPERYAEFADYAQSKGFTVILCGAPTEREKRLGGKITALSQHSLINLIGDTTLKQLLALLGRASVVVSPDSGPVHMATMMGTPVIGLYAHSNPARTGPYLSQQWTLEVYHRELAKKNRHRQKVRWGTRLKGKHLMAGITAAEVIAVFDAFCAHQVAEKGARQHG
ncbi:MAG TPA: glycosyltransferase family 9 protein [Marinagarivorans sp.]